MSLFAKIFGGRKSTPRDETPLVAEDAAPREVILTGIDCVVRQHRGNCATWTLESRPDHWIQFMNTVLNCHYPHKADPGVLFQELFNDPLVAEVVSFDPGTHVTVELSSMSPGEIADWIEHYLAQVFSADLPSERLTLEMNDF